MPVTSYAKRRSSTQRPARQLERPTPALSIGCRAEASADAGTVPQQCAALRVAPCSLPGVTRYPVSPFLEWRKEKASGLRAPLRFKVRLADTVRHSSSG
eukprot:scaffold3076_cov248-Pinguiococcus_pyrenoidosus.AAC.9